MGRRIRIRRKGAIRMTIEWQVVLNRDWCCQVLSKMNGRRFAAFCDGSLLSCDDDRHRATSTIAQA